MAIECIDVHKSFDGRRVLTGVDLAIPTDSVMVILGPSGTGKSVLLKHMIGLIKPDAGDVLVAGRSVPRMGNGQLNRLRLGLGVLFQDGALFGSMDVYDNVAFPLRQHTDLSERRIREIVMRRLREVGLTDAEALLPNELSGGMRKRVGFARALVLEPEIVLFDEPDSGLDPVKTALLCQLIETTHAERGGTYVIVTHDIATARRVGQYIALMWRGQIVEAGDAAAMFSSRHPVVRQFLDGEPVGPLGME
jgi:phospholipid/cholesterol/gamma-HCH transport system ATP-binding protein